MTPAARWVRVEHVMGMPVSVHARGPRARSEEVAAAVEEAFGLLRRADEVFSLWKPQSPLSRVHRGDLSLVDAAASHPEIGEVVALCAEAERRTRGAFTAYLPGPGAEPRFDPTGLVKGWAIDRAAGVLAQVPGHAYCLNAGGDIAVGGADGSDVTGGSADRPWQLGIEDPADRSRIAHVVQMRTGGLATSGTAARGAHLIDPVAGAPVRRGGSVSVAGPSILWADVWATALFVGPPGLQDTLLADHGWVVVRLPGRRDGAPSDAPRPAGVSSAQAA